MVEIRKETRGPYVWLVEEGGSKRGVAYDVTHCDDWIETPFGLFNRGWTISMPRWVSVPAPAKPKRKSFIRRLLGL